MAEILAISGIPTEEELDEQELERFQHYLSHPLPINLSSRSRLISSGLLSQYQVASLSEYRSRYGDVLSYSELATVEGFGKGFVERIRPFISLRSRSAPGKPSGDTVHSRQDALVRFALKGGATNYGVKYRFSSGESLEITAAARSYYSDNKQFPPSVWSSGMTFYGKRWLGKAVLGDYNLRIGQGLSLWSGLSLSGLSSSSSFSKRPTGLSPTWSWSGAGSHRGMAADFLIGRWSLVTFMSFPGLRGQMEGSKRTTVSLMPGLHAGWAGKSGQLGFGAWTGSDTGKLSGDFRWNLSGVDLFGEAAYDLRTGSMASLAGVSASLGEGWRINTVGRLYPKTYDGSFSGGVRSWTKTSDERGVAAGLEWFGAYLTADMAWKDSDRVKRQCKLSLKVPLQLGEKSVVSIRLTERIRPYEEYLVYRTGGRLDIDWSSAGLSSRYGEADGSAWKLHYRLEGLLCRSLAGLTYLEGGRKTDSWNVYLRGTVFLVDNWDDRIYSYERDAPGNFTVPAYYGRGFALSAVGGHKFRWGKKGALKVYFRASTVRYSFMRDPKPASNEAKLQVAASF